MDIAQSTTRISREIITARQKAHDKHGELSIESKLIDPDRMNAILVEEVGEISKCLNDKVLGKYNSPEEWLADLRSELIDAATVIFAWIARIDELP